MLGDRRLILIFQTERENFFPKQKQLVVVERALLLVRVTLGTLRVFVNQENPPVHALIQSGYHRVKIQVLLLKLLDLRAQPIQKVCFMLGLSL